jgi:hypothetical protein
MPRLAGKGKSLRYWFVSLDTNQYGLIQNSRIGPASLSLIHATPPTPPLAAVRQAAGTLPTASAPLAAPPAAAIILRLGLNEMDLQRSKQMLALLQRQPDQPRRVIGHDRATADLMNANGPIWSDHFQHDPPLHPEPPATTTRHSHGTPNFLDGPTRTRRVFR